MIDLTKKYQTRGGRPVKIWYAISNDPKSDIAGQFHSLDMGLVCLTWTSDGKLSGATAPSEFDLVEVKGSETHA